MIRGTLLVFFCLLSFSLAGCAHNSEHTRPTTRVSGQMDVGIGHTRSPASRLQQAPAYSHDTPQQHMY